MKRNSIKLVLALCFAASAVAQDITPAEKDKALHYLAETRDGLAGAVKGLSEAQWKFKPGPDRWSVAEVVEHLAVTEGVFVNNVRTSGDPLTLVPAIREQVRRVDADQGVSRRSAPWSNWWRTRSRARGFRPSSWRRSAFSPLCWRASEFMGSSLIR
jgi:hypothetical protein